MAYKSVLTILLMLTLCCIFCPLTSAKQTLPTDQSNPDNTLKYFGYYSNSSFVIGKNDCTLLFTNSSHYKQKTIQQDGYTHYKSTPTITTIIDYIFMESPQFDSNPYSYSSIYLNIKGNGLILNREQIAYERRLTAAEIKQHQEPYTQNEVNSNLNTLPDEVIIGKSPGANKQFGVFIDLKTLKKLAPELKNNFKWISTSLAISGYPSFEWVDTIYEPLQQPTKTDKKQK